MHIASADTPDAPDIAPPTVAQLLALSLFWFPNNLFWTVILLKFLPARVEELVGAASKGTYLFYISAAGAVATTLIQFVVAPLSDTCAAKWGRRHPFILIGTIGCAICNVLFATVGNFPLLLVSFFGIQIFLNAATGPYQALIPDNVPRSRQGLASAYMGVANLLGQLAAFVFLLFEKQLGMATIVYCITGLLIASMIVTVTGVPDRPALPDEQKPLADEIRSLTDWKIRENPDFYTLLGSRFFINLSYNTVVAFLLYYLKESVGPPEKGDGRLVYVLLAVTLSGLVGTLVAGTFADRVSKKLLIYVSCVVLATATLVFCLSSNWTVVLVLAGVFGAGWGAFSAVDWAMACNLLPKGGTAKYMAIWHACLTVPQMIAPAFGVVADILNKRYGHGIGWRAAMLSTVVYLVIGAAILTRVRERSAAAAPLEVVPV